MQGNQEKEAALPRTLRALQDHSADDLARLWGACFLAFFWPLALGATKEVFVDTVLMVVGFVYGYLSYLIARKRGWSKGQGILLAFLFSHWVLPLFVAVKGEIRKDGRMNPKALQALLGIMLFWLLGFFLLLQ